jgi:hypothetical protein
VSGNGHFTFLGAVDFEVDDTGALASARESTLVVLRSAERLARVEPLAAEGYPSLYVTKSRDRIVSTRSG